MIHHGRMLSDTKEDYDAFYACGVGAMFWRFDEGCRVLYFLAPPVGYKNPEVKFCMGRIYTMTDGKDWTVPGEVNGWDGNVERPTFHPSIWLRDRKGWHGFIRDGDLHDA